MTTFPTVQGTNLLRQKMTLPADFQGEFNLVLVAFMQWQQSEVNSWIPWIQEMERRYSGLKYYELPVIEDRSTLGKWFINEGMRAGIPNPVTRERTVTLYLKKTDFTKALDLQDEEHIHVLLLDENANVLATTRGYFADEPARSLQRLIENIFDQTK